MEILPSHQNPSNINAALQRSLLEFVFKMIVSPAALLNGRSQPPPPPPARPRPPPPFRAGRNTCGAACVTLALQIMPAWVVCMSARCADLEWRGERTASVWVNVLAVSWRQRGERGRKDREQGLACMP